MSNKVVKDSDYFVIKLTGRTFNGFLCKGWRDYPITFIATTLARDPSVMRFGDSGSARSLIPEVERFVSGIDRLANEGIRCTVEPVSVSGGSLDGFIKELYGDSVKDSIYTGSIDSGSWDSSKRYSAVQEQSGLVWSNEDSLETVLKTAQITSKAHGTMLVIENATKKILHRFGSVGDKKLGVGDSQWAPGWDMEGMWRGVKRDEANRNKVSLRIHSQNCDEDIAKLRRNISQLSGGTAEDRAWIPAYEATILELEKVKKYIEQLSVFKDSVGVEDNRVTGYAVKVDGVGWLQEYGIGGSGVRDAKLFHSESEARAMVLSNNDYYWHKGYNGKIYMWEVRVWNEGEGRDPFTMSGNRGIPIPLAKPRFFDDSLKGVSSGTKSFKVTDRRTGKVHLVRASDGLEALSKLSSKGVGDSSDRQNAEALWQRLKAAFNEEAAVYHEGYSSKLGSIGPVDRREVLRSRWWRFLGGDRYGDYDTITRLIETAHSGERLETGTIFFGS